MTAPTVDRNERRLRRLIEPKLLLRNSSFIRATFGITGVVRPDLLCRACGMESREVTAETAYVMRLFAARDLLLALKHFHAPSAGDEAAREILQEAAVTGLFEFGIMVSELRRRGAVTGGLRAGVVFALTDGIGYSVARLLADKPAAAREC